MTAARRAVRPTGALLALLLVLIAAGCSGGSRPRTMSSEATLDTLAGRITDMVSEDGIPIETDYVRCVASLDGRSAVCHGATSSEPAKDIKGTFAESGRAGPGCPGTLSVTIGPPLSDFDVPGPSTQLRAVSLDPCR